MPIFSYHLLDLLDDRKALAFLFSVGTGLAPASFLKTAAAPADPYQTEISAR